MTSGAPAIGAAPRAGTGPAWLPGGLLVAVLLCVYGGLALSVDFPRTAIGIQSDEATYYMMGYSLAHDGDLTYRREDLARVWREFPSGPVGVFLKKGRIIERVGMMRRPPFVWTRTRADSDPNRLFYGKSFAYPLFAAPFVKLFGTNGFLVLNALLLSAATLCGYLFLAARSRPAIAAALTGGFIMASVVPVYFVWIAPELFNFTLGVVAYFLWLYKEVARPPSEGPRTRWWFGAGSDVAAGVILGLATFSKVSNALLFPPVVLWLLWKRQWRTAAIASTAFTVTAVGLFAVNMAISGEWSYQGGERNTFYAEFPLQTPTSGFDVGAAKSRNDALTEVIFNREVFWTNLVHNLGYTFVGRYAGIVPYFFPAAFAMLAFLIGIHRRPLWQTLVLVGGLAQPLVFAIVTPVHVARRRRLGRQSLLHGRVRRVPVPAAADCERPGRTHSLGRRQRVRRATGTRIPSSPPSTPGATPRMVRCAGSRSS